MKILAHLAAELAHNLADIVKKIEISANFSFSHPDYSSLEIAPAMIESVQKLPLDLQEEYFTLQLQNYLEDIYFHGCLPKNKETENNSLPVKNNRIKGIDRDFYVQLEASNSGTGYFDPDWLVTKQEEDGSLAVKKDGLTFHIQRDRHLQPQAAQVTVNDLVAIRLPHNRWQDDCYVAISDRGLVEPAEDNRQQITQIYFNITPEGAIVLLKELTEQLNTLKLKFTLQILNEPDDYPCYDAVMLTVFSNDYVSTVEQVIKNLYPNIQPHLHNEIPLCTFQLAPGIGLAEATEEDFASSRCNAIAYGLLSAWYDGDNSPQHRLHCIQEAFSLAKINWQYPYLNSKVKHRYRPIT